MTNEDNLQCVLDLRSPCPLYGRPQSRRLLPGPRDKRWTKINEETRLFMNMMAKKKNPFNGVLRKKSKRHYLGMAKG